MTKRRLIVIASVVAALAILCLPTPRIFLCGATTTHLKSGEWVICGPRVPMSDIRFPWLVSAINAHGNIKCMRISNPGISDAGFSPVSKLQTLEWLFIEDSALGDRALDHFLALGNLKKLYFDRCPNISDEKVNWLRKVLPDCRISINEYTIGGD